MRSCITLWPTLTTTSGVTKELEWEALFEQFDRRVEFRADLQPGWSPAVFSEGRRSRDGVQRVFALVLDVDGTWDLDGATEAFGGYYGLIHTSKSHAAHRHCFRIILPLARPISAFEYDAIWRRIDAKWPNRVDRQAKDPSRFWYTPGVIGDGPFETRRLDGAPLDPEAWLAIPEPVAEPVFRAEPVESATDIEERARKYIERMDPAISGAGGHMATWRAAIALRGFGLGESRIFDILWSDYNPRCQPPWSEKELRHKAKQAVERAAVPAGYIVERDEPRRGPRALPPEAHADDDGWVPDEGCEPPEDLPPGAPDVRIEITGVQPDTERKPAWERYGVKTLAHTYRAVWDATQNKAEARACATGHPIIDRLIGGLRREHITGLGAETNWGKSSFAIQAVDLAERSGKRVLVVSGEDSEEMFGRRLAQRRCDINAVRMRDGTLDEHETSRLMLGVSNAAEVPWFLDARGKTAERTSAALAAILAEDDFDLVIVDYLQTFQARAQDRRNEVSKVARLFADAIKIGGAAGLLLSQLKRVEGRKPTLKDLKESGDIENMCEHVLVGWLEQGPDNRDPNRMERKRMIAVAKNKDGPVSNSDRPILMPFNDWTASFREITTSDELADATT